MGDADLRRAQLGRRVQRALPEEPREGADRALGRVRPAHPDRLRPGPPAGPRRGRQGRRPGPAPGRDAPAVRRHPARVDEHLHDDQRHRDVAARALPGRRRGAGARRRPRGGPRGGARPAGRHHPERHHQGVPLPGDLRLPARALAAADRGPDRLHGQPHPEVEPDQHLQLPPPGGRGDPDAGAGLRAVHGDRGARHRPRLRAGRARGLPRGGGADVVLRQRRRAVRRGDVQDARLRAAVGRDHPRAVRRRGPQDAPLPVRRAGQQPGPDRGPAGEQRPADRAGDARRHALQGRPRPRRPAARLERGARTAPALGPAVVASAPAGAGVRVRPAGVRRPVRGLDGRGGPGREPGGGCPRRDRPGAGPGRRGGRRRVRLHEAGAGLLARRPPRPDRVRGGQGRRGELLRDHRAVPADRRPRRRDPGRRPRGRAVRARRSRPLARRARPGRGRPPR